MWLLQATTEARDMALGLYERDPVHPLNADMVRYCHDSGAAAFAVALCEFCNMLPAAQDARAYWKVKRQRRSSARSCSHLQCATQELLHCGQGGHRHKLWLTCMYTALDHGFFSSRP